MVVPVRLSDVRKAFHQLVVQIYARTPSSLRTALVRMWTPNYTAGVVALLVRPNGDVLFMKPTYRRGWVLPGGLLGHHEAPELTVRREVEEELGIKVQPHAYRVATQPERHMVTTFTIASITDEQVAQLRPDPIEVASIKWFAPDDMPVLDDEVAPLESADFDAVRQFVSRLE